MHSPDGMEGIDAFFELDVGDGRSKVVTMDISFNEGKAQGYKADIVVMWPAAGIDRKDPDDKEAWGEKVTVTAQRVIDKFYEKGYSDVRPLTDEELEQSQKIRNARQFISKLV